MYNYIPNEIEVEVSPDDLQGLEAELVLDPDEVLAFAQETGELQGLEDVEQIEKLRRLFHRFRIPLAKAVVRRLPMTGTFRRIVERTTHKAIKKIAPAVGGHTQAKVWYHKKKLVGNSLTFFSKQDAEDETNLLTLGKLSDSDVIIKRLAIWFTPTVLTDTQLGYVNEVMKGKFTLKIGNKEVIEAPVDFVADSNVVAVADGNTSAILKYVMRNSRLDRGMLILDNLHIPKNKTIEATITGFNVPSSSDNIFINVGLAGVEIGG